MSCIKYLEVLGLSLLLISFGWQTFEEVDADITINAEWDIVNQKLDDLWSGEKVICQNVKCQEYEGSTGLDFKHWARRDQVLGNIQQQYDWLKSIRIILYILGSLLIIVGKIFEKRNLD